MTQKRCNVAVLASGTGSNFQAIVEACRRDDYPARVVCLVTDNPDAEALDIARRFEVAAHVVHAAPKKAGLPEPAETKIVSLCADHSVDLVALAGFMRILSGPLLSGFEGRIMNIHPSLLPSFKGLHAAKQALDYGAKVTGCTVHFVDRTVDGGAIILQACVEVADGDDEESLLQKIHEQEYRTYVRAIELYALDRLRIQGRRVMIAG
ncbi:MAG: phosphoribosylglycinamide formyltransferase [Candidatus Krumholzibacteria bacterium]